MTAKLVLDTRYQRKDNLYPIVIAVRSVEQSRLVKTGYYAPKSSWNSKSSEVKANYRDAETINAAIAKQLADMRSRMLKAKSEGITDINRIITGQLAPAPALLFSEYIESRAKHYDAIKKLKHARKIRLLLLNLQECLCKEKIPAEATEREKKAIWAKVPVPFALTADDMRAFHVSLKDKNNNPNTIHKKFNLLGDLFTNAGKEGKTNAVNAFKNFKLSTKPVSKDKLTKREMAAIEILHLPDGLLNDTRNLFLFSYYCKGMRFEDCLRVKKTDIINDRIVFREIRKGHSQVSVKLHDKLKQLIQHYINNDTPYLFPLLKAELLIDKTGIQTNESEVERLNKVEGQNAIVNKSLKIIAAAAGIQTNLSAHIARHSFAQHLKEAKVHINVIKDALAHSSVAVTERYLRALDDSTIDNEVNQIYD